jgi:hypothetical protein
MLLGGHGDTTERKIIRGMINIRWQEKKCRNGVSIEYSKKQGYLIKAK